MKDLVGNRNFADMRCTGMGHNNKSSVLFGSVIYKNALQYFDEFMGSIKRQTIDAFRVLLLLDGISIEEIKHKILSIKDCGIIIECGDKYNPPQLRIKLIQEAKKRGADFLIIGDADDLFSNNRIESVINSFNKNPSADFVYNNLYLFNGNRVMPKLPEQVNDIKDIAEKNFLGMSNTAIRVSTLSDDFVQSLFECSSFVFDWYLYSRLLLAGHVGVVAENVYTLYRIYDGNYAGIPEATAENIEKEIEIKKQHYRQLKNMDPLFERLYECYNNGKIQKVDSKETEHFWWDLTRAREIVIQ